MSWEDEDTFSVPTTKPLVEEKKSWDDEDKESWEDADKPKKPAAPAAKPEAKPAGKTAAKATAKKAEVKPPAAPAVKLTPEEEKRKRQDEIVKSDFANAKDLFSGVAESEKEQQEEKKLATFVPITEADFEDFAKLVNERLTPAKGSYHYLKFMKSLLKLSTDQMKPEDVKALGVTINTIVNDRLAAEKAKDNPKAKKKGKGAVKKAEDFAEEDFVDDELDAFM